MATVNLVINFSSVGGYWNWASLWYIANRMLTISATLSHSSLTHCTLLHVLIAQLYSLRFIQSAVVWYETGAACSSSNNIHSIHNPQPIIVSRPTPFTCAFQLHHRHNPDDLCAHLDNDSSTSWESSISLACLYTWVQQDDLNKHAKKMLQDPTQLRQSLSMFQPSLFLSRPIPLDLFTP